MIKYIIGIITISIIGLLYNRVEKKYLKEQHYDLVSKYLIKGIPDTNKPILWIYIPNKINARSWKNWGSRNTTDINIPYIQWTIESIIHKAGDDFNIYFVQNESFSLLLPNLKIDLEKLADPERSHIIDFAMLQILYHYGGIVIPMSFIAIRPIIQLYQYGTINNELFLVHSPSLFIGSIAKCRKMELLLQDVQQLFSSHHTEYTSIKFRNILNQHVKHIPEQLTGVRDIENNKIHLDIMMHEEPLQLHKNLFGFVIPTDEILRSTKYQWFAYVNNQDVLLMDNSLSKLLSSTRLK